MGVTVQVRDLNAGVQQQLKAAASREGLSLSTYLRRELTRLAGEAEVRARADALNSRGPLGGPYLEGTDIQEIVRMTREDRDRR